MKKESYYYIAFISTILIAFILDISTKLLVLKYLTKPIDIIPGFFSLNLNFNYGAAFGILNGMQWLFITIFLVIIVAIYKFKEKLVGSFPLCIAFGLVIGGAAGNIVDRLAFMPKGGVTDFLDFHLKNADKLLAYPTFNIADSCIVIGVIIILMLFGRQRN